MVKTSPEKADFRESSNWRGISLIGSNNLGEILISVEWREV